MPNSSQVEESRIWIFASCSISSLMPWSFSQRQTGSGAKVKRTTLSDSAAGSLPPPPPPPPSLRSSEHPASASTAAIAISVVHLNIEVSPPSVEEQRGAEVLRALRAAIPQPLHVRPSLRRQPVHTLRVRLDEVAVRVP